MAIAYAVLIFGGSSSAAPESPPPSFPRSPEIDRLAVYARDVLTSVPDNARVLITAHDAFNYFGRAYDIEVIGGVLAEDVLELFR